MVKIDVEKLDEDQKARLLKKAVEKYGLSYVANKLGVDRSTLYRYVAGKVKRIPEEVVKAVAEMLSVEEVSDAVYGLKTVDVDPTTALSVIVKALRDEGFRNFFLSLLYQYMGDYLKATSSTYIVSEDDVKRFEKTLQEKAKSTRDMRMRYLKRALAELGYELSPDGIRDLLAELSEESPNVARHTATTLKLFLKTVVREKNLQLAQTLYNSFRVPKTRYRHRPQPLTLEALKKVFGAIEHLGAKAYFLLLVETGLRVGEVYSIMIDQVDLEHRIIRIMKESETKRAYITFLHVETTKWLRETYLPYREEFVRRYEPAVRGIGQDVEKWKRKLFPFQLPDIRYSIKQAMRAALGKEFRLYDVRSFWASYMLKQGVSPMLVNVLQGRAPPQQFKILQDHYFVISDIELQQIYDKYAPRLL